MIVLASWPLQVRLCYPASTNQKAASNKRISCAQLFHFQVKSSLLVAMLFEHLCIPAVFQPKPYETNLHKNIFHANPLLTWLRIYIYIYITKSFSSHVPVNIHMFVAAKRQSSLNISTSQSVSSPTS